MLDKRILEFYESTSAPSPEQIARTRAAICSGPAFIKKDGKLVFSPQKTREAYNNMYEIFLQNEKERGA